MRSQDSLQRLLALHPREIDLSLDRLTRLLRDFNHPERQLPPIVHVAGTNGKGSTIALMRAALEAAGKRVHTYTSPHLVHFHERIRLAGTLITEQQLLKALVAVERANNGQNITFFEATTAAAFLAFSQMPADALLLEVGLGGRLDATNVIDKPVVSVITPVAKDHERFLTDDLAVIAGEKAGILRANVPSVIAPQDPVAAHSITKRADRVGAPLVWIDDAQLAAAPQSSLVGAHQRVNAAVAAEAMRITGWVTEYHIEQGFKRAVWPGRLQLLAPGPLTDCLGPNAEIWLDGGHNPHAGQSLAIFLWQREIEDPRPLHIITGMLDTKASNGFLAALAQTNPMIWTVKIPNTQASRSAEDVAQIAHAQGLPAVPCTDVHDAIGRISHSPAPRLMIAGSLYLAGYVLKKNNQILN